MNKEYTVMEGGIEYLVKCHEALLVEEWYLNHQLHRELGPAVIWKDGEKQWYQHGNYHRLDGPAIIFADGYSIWYYQDKRVDVTTQEEFEQWLKLKVFL